MKKGDVVYCYQRIKDMPALTIPWKAIIDANMGSRLLVIVDGHKITINAGSASTQKPSSLANKTD